VGEALILIHTGNVNLAMYTNSLAQRNFERAQRILLEICGEKEEDDSVAKRLNIYMETLKRGIIYKTSWGNAFYPNVRNIYLISMRV